MKTEIKAFDSEVGVDVTPINLPTNYKPVVGQIIETTDGMYEVRRYEESNMNGFVTRISLTVRRC